MPEGIWGTVFVALWLVLLAQTAMLVILSRQLRGLYPQHGPDVSAVGLALGARAPEIEVEDLAGDRISLGGPSPRKRLLIFLSPGCLGCRAAIREIKQLSPQGAQIILLWSASPEKVRDLAEEYQLQLPMVGTEGAELWKLFMISGVPFAMAVDEQGRVAAKAYAHSREQLEALLVSPERDAPAPLAASAPEPAPPRGQVAGEATLS